MQNSLTDLFDLGLQVASLGKLSYTSAQQLHEKIEQLPKPPAWKGRVVTVEGGTTKDPIVLLYRDGLEVFKFLFGNPIFKGQQSHVPRHTWEDDSREVQFFGEPNTGDYVFEIQVIGVHSRLPRRWLTFFAG